jgi:hypothetical protein
LAEQTDSKRFERPLNYSQLGKLPIVTTAQLEELLAKLGFERGSVSKATSPEEKSALTKLGKVIEAELNGTAPLDFDDVDEELGITAIIEEDAPLRARLLDPGDDTDHSTNDFEIALHLRRWLGARFDHHAARAVFAHFPACSAEEKQTAHFVANIMSKAESETPYSEGAAFGVVDDEDRAEYLADPVAFKEWCEREAELKTGYGKDRKGTGE